MKNINTISKRFVLTASLFLMMLLAFNPLANAQVGIGTNTPHASAALDVTSTTQGFLMPRLTTAQRTGITSPATGLMVIDTELKAVMVYVDGAWTEVGGGVKQQAEVMDLNEEATLTDITSVVGVWEEQSSGTSSTSGNVNYTTSGDYTLENSTYVTVDGGVAKMIATVPVYSADVCTGGTALGTTHYVGYEPSKAFDENNTTWWATPNGTVSDKISYQLLSGAIATKYAITAYLNDRAPKDWKLQGSNNSTNGTDGIWTDLDTRTGESFSDDQKKEFTFSNSTSYTFYRINITANTGGATKNLQIKEIDIFTTSSYDYQTANAYYVTTKAASNVDANIASIDDVVFTGSGLGDSRFALSFDGGGTWKKYNAGSWVNIALADVDASGNSQAELEALTTITTAGNSIDVAVALKATNATTNAILGNVEVTYSYNTGTFYKKMDESDFQIRRTNATGKQNIIVKKLSAGTDKNVVIDYIK